MAEPQDDEEEDRELELVNKSSLMFNLKPGQLPIVYHPDYNISFWGLERCHPFDAGKWGKIHQILIDREMFVEEACIRPLEATNDDLLVVHTQAYLDSLKWSCHVATIMEVPPVAFLPNCLVQRKALRPFRLHTGGSILAGFLAMQHGWAINLGGGFHHCSSDRGGGFCAYADISLMIRFLQKKELIRTALIVDLDAHQGNGHERDFTGDENVFIFDMFNKDIYPQDRRAKKGIGQAVELKSRTNDEDYLELLENHLTEVLVKFHPDILVYNAGTDSLEGDPLGQLSLTAEGIRRRDEFVFQQAKTRQIPIVMLTSGGYQQNNAQVIADSIFHLRGNDFLPNPQ